MGQALLLCIALAGASRRRRWRGPRRADRFHLRCFSEAAADPASEFVNEELVEAKLESDLVDDGGGATDAGAGGSPGTGASGSTWWDCGECGSSNLGAAGACHRCGAARPSERELGLLRRQREMDDEVARATDRLLRLQADLQNYRRQHAEALRRARELGEQDLLRRLVPFSDDVRRALVPPEGLAGGERRLFDSSSTVFRKLDAVWGRLRVARLATEVGEAFDPTRHEWAEERRVPGRPPGSVLEVLRPGWRHGGATGAVLVRSRVAVQAAPGDDDEEGADERPASPGSGGT